MNIQTKIDFHFVKCRFSEMPCINRTAEVHLTFRRSELFYYFCIRPAFLQDLAYAPGAIHSLLAYSWGFFCPPRITFSLT